MENLRYEPTLKSPAIDFNAKTGILSIQGESWMDYAFEFFKPLLAWIEEYNKSPKEITECKIDGNDDGYRFNDASSKCLLDVLKNWKIYMVKQAGWLLSGIATVTPMCIFVKIIKVY